METKVKEEFEEILNRHFISFGIKWKEEPETGFLPPFNMKKAKHNNRKGINIKGSGIIKYISKGRVSRKPYGYTSFFENENEGEKVQSIFVLFGIYPQLQTLPEVSITITFSDAMKFIGRVKKNQKKYLKENKID